MKKNYILFALLFTLFTARAQDTCQTPICFIDYIWHDDRATNPVMTAIITFKPKVLVTNSQHGLYQDSIYPSNYQAYGIEVYIYITGSYENSADSAANISRIEGIHLDGADGVMLDQVSSLLTPQKKSYIASIFDKCHSLGLKLILNPGDNSFDTFLISHSDYVISSEHFTGATGPSSSELAAMSHMIVLNEGGATSGAAAATISDTARRQGYAMSYACEHYTMLPSWLDSYKTLITYATPTPSVGISGSSFHSSAPYGNQWYSVAGGMVAGATWQNFTPMVAGAYYDIVTTNGCAARPSDTLSMTTTGISTITSNGCYIYPNPTTSEIHIDNAEGKTVTLFNVVGKALFTQELTKAKEVINIEKITMGIYMIEVSGDRERTIFKVIKE